MTNPRQRTGSEEVAAGCVSPATPGDQFFLQWEIIWVVLLMAHPAELLWAGKAGAEAARAGTQQVSQTGTWNSHGQAGSKGWKLSQPLWNKVCEAKPHVANRHCKSS